MKCQTEHTHTALLQFSQWKTPVEIIFVLTCWSGVSSPAVWNNPSSSHAKNITTQTLMEIQTQCHSILPTTTKWNIMSPCQKYQIQPRTPDIVRKYQFCINSLLSAKKLTEQSQRRAEAGDEVLMIKRSRVYWIILVVYDSLLRLCLSSTNPTSVVIPQAIEMEMYFFTTTSCDIKNLEMETLSYSWRQIALQTTHCKTK